MTVLARETGRDAAGRAVRQGQEVVAMVKDVAAAVDPLDVRPGMRLMGPDGWREVCEVQYEASGPSGFAVVRFEAGRVTVVRIDGGEVAPYEQVNRPVERSDRALDLLTQYAGRQVRAEMATWWATYRDGGETLALTPVGLVVTLFTPSELALAYERQSRCGDPKPHPNHDWPYLHEDDGRWCPGETPGIEAFR